jgi:hypothetical protein
MSLYQVQKLVQAVNRNPAARARYAEDRESLVAEYALTAIEQAAITNMNMFELYDMGVHPLLLRPFTIINGVSEPDYLKAIRGDE